MTRRTGALRVLLTALVVTLAIFVLPGTAGAANPWIRVAAPSPGSATNQLISTDCVTATTCVAVGWYAATAGPVRPLVVRTTDGTTWTRATTPSLGSLSELFDVSCSTATDCTAVGATKVGGTTKDPRFATVVLRTTNGTSWSRVTSPNPFGFSSILWGVDCVSALRCRAVGDAEGNTIVLRTGDGARWFRQPTPNLGQGANSLISIDCVSNVNCTAVGYYYNQPLASDKQRTLVLHTVNGRDWLSVASPNPSPSTSDASLVDVSCAGATCTAAGTLDPAPGVQRAFLLRTTNGSVWSRPATPTAPGQVVMQGIDCRSATTCTAVGYQWNAGHTVFSGALLRTVDGTTWSSPSPASERVGRGLVGVSCATPMQCVGVGSFNGDGTENGLFRTLVMKEA